MQKKKKSRSRKNQNRSAACADAYAHRESHSSFFKPSPSLTRMWSVYDCILILHFTITEEDTSRVPLYCRVLRYSRLALLLSKVMHWPISQSTRGRWLRSPWKCYSRLHSINTDDFSYIALHIITL